MQLYQKQKTLSRFFSAFLKCGLNFEHFERKDDSHRFCNCEITESKTWLDKCLKSHFLEDPSKNNMVNGPKHC